MTLTKLRPTFTFDQDRLDALKAIAPEAFADGKVNWDVLKEALPLHRWTLARATVSCASPLTW